MSLLFETIRVTDGVLQNLEYHNYRLNESRKALFDAPDLIYLEQCIHVPAIYTKGLFKCRVKYSMQIEDISFEAYSTRLVRSLKLVEDNSISYSYKFSNRDHLSELLLKKGNCDDILIIKNGFITDTSYSNIVFFDGYRWYTPLSPLLPGTMRRHLLVNKLISEAEIKVTDLNNYHQARLINAMLPFYAKMDIEINAIGY